MKLFEDSAIEANERSMEILLALWNGPRTSLRNDYTSALLWRGIAASDPGLKDPR